MRRLSTAFWMLLRCTHSGIRRSAIHGSVAPPLLHQRHAEIPGDAHVHIILVAGAIRHRRELFRAKFSIQAVLHEHIDAEAHGVGLRFFLHPRQRRRFHELRMLFEKLRRKGIAVRPVVDHRQKMVDLRQARLGVQDLCDEESVHVDLLHIIVRRHREKFRQPRILFERFRDGALRRQPHAKNPRRIDRRHELGVKISVALVDICYQRRANLFSNRHCFSSSGSVSKSRKK